MSKETAGKKTQAGPTAGPEQEEAVEAAAKPTADTLAEVKVASKWWAALTGVPARVWGAVSGAAGKAWRAVAGAAVKVWGALRGTATSLKATTLKVAAACAAWWKARSKGAKTWLIAGGAAAVVAIAVAVFLVLFLRPVFVVEVFQMDEAVVVGEDVVMSMDVVNEGRTTGDRKLRVFLDGQQVDAEQLVLDPGARQHIVFTISGLAAGHYDIALAGWPELAQQVWVMTPPKFEMGAVGVQPNPMDIATSDEAEVTVALANVGEATGTYELAVTLDGEAVETREVEVKGGVSVDETFTVKVPEPGSCEIAVNGQGVDVEVYRLGRPENGERIAQERYGMYNTLKIKNAGDLDCVVGITLQNPGHPSFLVVYVRAQNECSVGGIVSGTYRCTYSFGEDWCTYRKEFTSNLRSGELGELLTFSLGRFTFSASGGMSTISQAYTVVSLELGGASGESVSTSQAVRTKSLPYPSGGSF